MIQNEFLASGHRIQDTSKKLQTVFFVLFLACSVQLVALRTIFAQPLSSGELINDAKTYDGKTVVYAGEVVGEVMRRGEYAWVNLNDGDHAIGVWIPAGLAAEIEFQGSYKSKGDVVEVVGVFHRACAQHGGDLDIHASAMKKIRSGKIIRERMNTGKRNIVFLLSGVLIIVWIWTRLKAK